MQYLQTPKQNIILYTRGLASRTPLRYYANRHPDLGQK